MKKNEKRNIAALEKAIQKARKSDCEYQEEQARK